MDLARNLKVDSVSRLQPTPPRGLPAERPVTEAIDLMRAERVGCLLVCRGEQLVGVFTERDLMARVLAPGKPLTAPVADYMTPAPVTVQPKDSISCALRRMQEGGYRHLPVVDAGNRPVGILSIKRIVHYVVEHFPATVYNQPPNPDAVPQAREGA
jgi:signal-transduction protein with cAMP-binding, CBS, and nucleotidyltransferase domain